LELGVATTAVSRCAAGKKAERAAAENNLAAEQPSRGSYS